MDFQTVLENDPILNPLQHCPSCLEPTLKVRRHTAQCQNPTCERHGRHEPYVPELDLIEIPAGLMVHEPDEDEDGGGW